MVAANRGEYGPLSDNIHESLWTFIDFSAGHLLVSYYEAVLAPHISYRCAFKEVRFDSGKKIFIEKRPIRQDLPVANNERRFFEANVLHLSASLDASRPSVPEEMMPSEFIQPGLQDYF